MTQLAFDLEAATEAEEPSPPPLPAYVPSERIVPIIEAWLAKDEARNLRVLAQAAHVGVDALRKLMRGETALVRFSTADRLVTYIDVWAWYRPPEDGGLADLYGAGRAPASAVRSGDYEKAGAAQQRPPARHQEVKS